MECKKIYSVQSQNSANKKIQPPTEKVPGPFSSAGMKLDLALFGLQPHGVEVR